MMTMNSDNALQDYFLRKLYQEKKAVSIFLKNGIQLKGMIKAFDSHVILFQGGGLVQLVYRHAISTILPSEGFKLDDSELQAMV